MADDDLIAYDFAMLNQAADDCKSAVGNITTTLGDLEKTANNLLSTWTGSAQGAYHQRQTEWNQAGTDLKDLLSKIEKTLRETAMRMASSEHKNKQRFGG
jgi:early secretory antigenic target protein ESAT-6